MDLAAVIVIVMVALSFDFTNGFHDAANAIATSVSTRALTPRAALAMAAVMNLIGAHLGTGVAKTVGSDIIDTPTGRGDCSSSSRRSSAPSPGTWSPGAWACRRRRPTPLSAAWSARRSAPPAE